MQFNPSLNDNTQFPVKSLTAQFIENGAPYLTAGGKTILASVGKIAISTISMGLILVQNFSKWNTSSAKPMDHDEMYIDCDTSSEAGELRALKFKESMKTASKTSE